MSRMAAAASRRNKTQSSTITPERKSASSTPGPHSKFAREPSPTVPAQSSPRTSKTHTRYLNKPLPKEPRAILAATDASTPAPHPLPFADRYESPRQSPPDPNTSPKTSSASGGERPRPKTAGEARAADARGNSTELLDFLQRPDPLGSNPNPLRSNPPDESLVLPERINIPQKLGRSNSQGPKLVMGSVPGNEDKARVHRSRSQGALDILSTAPTQAVNTTTIQGKASAEKIDLMLNAGKRDEPVRSSSEQVEKRAAMRGTGFARRLSKRLKHLPIALEAPTGSRKVPFTSEKPTTIAEEPMIVTQKPAIIAEETVIVHKTAPPPDSAYSSLKAKDSPPNEPIPDTPGQRESFLGPLPFEHLPPPPPIPSADQQHSSVNGKEVPASVRSLTSSKSRSLSVRNLFRNRWKKEKTLPA